MACGPSSSMVAIAARGRFTPPPDRAGGSIEKAAPPMATNPVAGNGATAGVTRSSAKKRIRKIFGDIHEVVKMPNLIEVQRESYEQFLRSDPATGYVSGLEKTLRSVFPIRDFAGTSELDFVHYELEDPKYDTTECRQRGITYAAPMKVTLRLIVFEVDAETETRSVLDIKEQDVYMGDMPLMTENGTFIINGTERVIVSQMHRSPGVLFDHDRGKDRRRTLRASSCSPRASFPIAARGSISSSTPRTSSTSASTASASCRSPRCSTRSASTTSRSSTTSTRPSPGSAAQRERRRLALPFVPEQWRGTKPTFEIVDAQSGEVIFPAGQKITPRAANKAQKDGLTSC